MGRRAAGGRSAREVEQGRRTAPPRRHRQQQPADRLRQDRLRQALYLQRQPLLHRVHQQHVDARRGPLRAGPQGRVREADRPLAERRGLRALRPVFRRQEDRLRLEARLAGGLPHIRGERRRHGPEAANVPAGEREVARRDVPRPASLPPRHRRHASLLPAGWRHLLHLHSLPVRHPLRRPRRFHHDRPLPHGPRREEHAEAHQQLGLRGIARHAARRAHPLHPLGVLRQGRREPQVPLGRAARRHHVQRDLRRGHLPSADVHLRPTDPRRAQQVRRPRHAALPAERYRDGDPPEHGPRHPHARADDLHDSLHRHPSRGGLFLPLRRRAVAPRRPRQRAAVQGPLPAEREVLPRRPQARGLGLEQPQGIRDLPAG